MYHCSGHGSIIASRAEKIACVRARTSCSWSPVGSCFTGSRWPLTWSLQGPVLRIVAATTDACVRSASRASPSGTLIVSPKNSTSTPDCDCGMSISAATISLPRSGSQ